jgi:calcium-dependent protein kinase
MELCTGGSVLDRMPYKDEKQVVKILHQLISAVCYLHQQQHVAHRDIEPSNILYETEDEDSDIKLIDFGCATQLEPSDKGGYKFLTEKTGTLHIMAPEVLKGKYSPQADMWSVGVVAYTLFQDGKKPFDGPTMYVDVAPCIYVLNFFSFITCSSFVSFHSFLCPPFFVVRRLNNRFQWRA